MLRYEELTTPEAVLAAFEARRHVEYKPKGYGMWGRAMWPKAVEVNMRIGVLYRALIEDALPDFPECSGDPASCPENEGYGCCRPNPKDAPPIPAGCRVESERAQEGLTSKQAWWAGARAGLGVAADMPREHVAALLSAQRNAQRKPAQPSQQGEAVDDALEEAFRRYPHAHDALTFLACAIRGPVKPSKADLEWAVSQAFPDGNATIPVESLGRDAEGVEALLASENPERKDFTVDEALKIADRHDSAHKHVPSVSRTLAAEVRRLRPAVDEAMVERVSAHLLASKTDNVGDENESISLVDVLAQSFGHKTIGPVREWVEEAVFESLTAALNPEQDNG